MSDVVITVPHSRCADGEAHREMHTCDPIALRSAERIRAGLERRGLAVQLIPSAQNRTEIDDNRVTSGTPLWRQLRARLAAPPRWLVDVHSFNADTREARDVSPRLHDAALFTAPGARRARAAARRIPAPHVPARDEFSVVRHAAAHSVPALMIEFSEERAPPPEKLIQRIVDVIADDITRRDNVRALLPALITIAIIVAAVVFVRAVHARRTHRSRFCGAAPRRAAHDHRPHPARARDRG